MDDLLELDGEITKNYKEIIDYMNKNNVTPRDMKTLVDAVKQGNPYKENNYSIGKNHVKFGLTGDFHIGNNEYRPELMTHAGKIGTKKKVDFWLLGGDLFDGWYQNRPTSLFEQNAIGLDNQLEMVKTELKKLEQPLYFITANHEYNTFMRGAGVEVGYYLEDKLKLQGQEAHFLGNAEGTVTVGNGTKLMMMHPDGGTAYALSYRPQKISESFEGGKKPEFLSIHHFHKAEYLFYRNIHIVQAATMCGQTKFMKGKNISAHMGFWIIDMYTDKNGGIDQITPMFYPAYK